MGQQSAKQTNRSDRQTKADPRTDSSTDRPIRMEAGTRTGINETNRHRHTDDSQAGKHPKIPEGPKASSGDMFLVQ